MLESLSTNKLEYEKLSLEEQQKRGILGRLVGVMADYVNPTRNGRRYSEQLWDKVFQDPIMQEKIKNRCCFGELGHPSDRTEVDMEKIAICLAEQPKKGKDGCLYGVFDILNTPNGRILKCLCDYGCNIGVSSRGEGDLIPGIDGDDVDPDTYMCECWDAVLIPSVMKARPAYVTESLHQPTALWESLNTIIDSSTDDNKKVMKESLELLGLTNYSQESLSPVDNIEEAKDLAVDNNQAQEDNLLLQQLQESLKQQEILRRTIENLQSQLSVSYTKETSQKEDLDKYQKAIGRLTEQVANGKISIQINEKLKKQLQDSLSLNKQKDAIIKDLKSKLLESKTNNEKSKKDYQQQIESLTQNVNTLNENLSIVNNQYSQLLENSKTSNQKLQESIQTKEKDFQMKTNELKGKLEKQKKLTEKYHSIAIKAVDKYMESKAIALGISVNEIKNRLSESYTFSEIDQICEDLRQYKLNINKLPFNSSSIAKQLVEGSKIKAKAPKSSILPKEGYEGVDEIDPQLLSLAGLD